jgi:uncharacterized protein (TIGR03086 family)
VTTGGTAVLTGGVGLLERAMGYTLGSLRLVTPAAMSNPTPCRGWDLRALLRHLNDSLLALHEAVAVGHVGLDPAGNYGGPALDPAVDPVAALRNSGCRMIGAWANATEADEVSIGDRRLSPGIVAATGAVDVAVHGWDVARACGHDRPVPPALARELLELCRLLIGEADRPGRFAAPVDIPLPAGPGDRLVAFLGRRPG